VDTRVVARSDREAVAAGYPVDPGGELTLLPPDMVVIDAAADPVSRDNIEVPAHKESLLCSQSSVAGYRPSGRGESHPRPLGAPHGHR
jgi:hypothetical protein